MHRRGKRIGYVRVSSLAQNDARQLENVELDKVFTDKLSGKDMNRPQLQAALEYARDGDSFIVHSMDRLARNLDDLRKIVTELNQKGVEVRFEKEGMSFTGDDAHITRLTLNILGAFAEFERSLLRERQREGIAIAKKAGLYRGRKRSLTPERVMELRKRVEAGEKRAALAREFGISRETLYQYVRSAKSSELFEAEVPRP